jgi:hypothetical protein
VAVNPALDICSYKADGFEKVCKVMPVWTGEWWYADICEELMFSDHRSWVYFIVVDQEIFKVGETGNPLGIRSTRGNREQPKKGSESRFGRLRDGDQTDAVIRESLSDWARVGKVELWARRCDIVEIPVILAGQPSQTSVTYHKDLEMRYLDHIYEQTGGYPRLNKARK